MDTKKTKAPLRHLTNRQSRRRPEGTAYPVEEHRVLRHAVRPAELLHPPAVVAVKRLLALAAAVGAGPPGALAPGRHLLSELLLAGLKREVGGGVEHC